MKKAVLTLTNKDPKGNPIGDLVVTMEFLKTLPAPQVSLFSFTFELEGQIQLQFHLICDDAVTFFRLLANIMAPTPVLPGSATRINTSDSNGNPNGAIQIKMTLYPYLDPSGNTITYFTYSFLPDNDIELGFLLGSFDADVFYYDFDCFMSTNPPNPA
jgi:hypothetical protein